MLENIWFVLWAVLWAVYFILDGFDFGSAMLMPFITKNEQEKSQIIGAIAPFWDANEVWLITAGGVTFAAFPTTYAVMFSSLYSPLMIILFALIIRAVSIEFRGVFNKPEWKNLWETGLFISSLIPALLFGVAFANIFAGIPFDAEGIYQGNILTLLNPYGILGGLLFVALFLLHGALWLTAKTTGDLLETCRFAADKLWYLVFSLAVIFLVMSFYSTNLYDNYLSTPVLFIIPALAVAGLVLTRYFVNKQCPWKSWFASMLTIVSSVAFGIAGIYPNLFPSSINTDFSLNIYNSSSSHLTLTIMLVVVLIFIPVVIAYQIWFYYLFQKEKPVPLNL